MDVMYGCARCYAKGVDALIVGRPIKLTGEYHTCLCDDCLNEWVERINNSIDYAILRELESRMRILEHTGQDTQDIVNEIMDSEIKMFQHAKKFVEGDDDKPA
jgi:hypothetical protein